MKDAIEKAADNYESHWHKVYPDGMMVADYCNREMPGTVFRYGIEFGRQLEQASAGKLAKVLERLLDRKCEETVRSAQQALAEYEDEKCINLPKRTK